MEFYVDSDFVELFWNILFDLCGTFILLCLQALMMSDVFFKSYYKI